jgi:mono/diheme cytochrome c family protein
MTSHNKNVLFRIVILAHFIVLSLSSNVYAYTPSRAIDVNDEATQQRLDEGLALFKANCTSCHAINRKLTGPALANSWKNWDSEEKLISWIRNSQAMIKSGDPYAVALFNEYNQSVMTSFLQLNEDQVINIIDYIRAATDNTWPPSTEPVVDASATTGSPSESSDIVLYILLALLAGVALLAWRVISKMNKIIAEKEGEPFKDSDPLLVRLFSKKTFSILAILLVIFIGYNLAKGAIGLGRSQGYEPDQPIKFSHAIHAGQNQIDCKYCHSGADKSKHSVIPAVNVCMNCHKYVQEGPKYGKEEIAKIYEAAGWDPENGRFVREAKPIEWVKIHNLPDHVYFNHAQHVNAGGLECQTCHGPIQEMEVVKQFAPLSMGWCINCHRETEVKFADNEYYSIFEKYHDDIKKGKRKGVTVEDIGGTECQKCHY